MSYGKLPDNRTLYNRLRQSARKRNLDFSLTLTDLNNITFPITCPVCNRPLQFNRDGFVDNSYSFDRIDSDLGYHIDNLIIICLRCNKLKNNATKTELHQLAKFYNS